MKKFKCFAVVLFFLCLCAVAGANDTDKAKKKCWDLLVKEGPTIGEIQADLADCKKLFSPDVYVALQKAAIKYAEESIFEAKAEMLSQAWEEANKKSKEE